MNRAIAGRAIAVGGLLALGIVAWATGIAHRFFDYDEICHAHVTWLIAAGDRPFIDFHEVHTPFLWYPIAAFWRLSSDSPAMLLPLRALAGVGTVLSMVALAGSIRAVRRELPLAWIVVGISAVLVDRAILDYAVEFRPDGWSYALLFGAFFLFLHKWPQSISARYGLFGFLAGLGVLTSPKFVLLPLIFVVADLGGGLVRRRPILPALAACAAGAAAALGVGVSALWLAGVGPRVAFDMALRYQWVFIEHTAFTRGLLASVSSQGHLLLVVGAGVIAWAAHLFRLRRTPHAFEVAVLLFLVAQLLVVERPYKQYYAPWFLLAACFVPFIGLLAERLAPRTASALLMLGIAAGGWSAWRSLESFANANQVAPMLAFYDAILKLAPPDARIVAFPPMHPAVRRDVFYGWSRTTDPRGFGTEAIMRQLNLPGYSQRFEKAYYTLELERHPPAVVVMPGAGESAYEPEQSAALAEYLASHRDEYATAGRDMLRPLMVRRER